MHHRVKYGVLLAFIASIALSLYTLKHPNGAASFPRPEAEVASLIRGDLEHEASHLVGIDHTDQVPSEEIPVPLDEQGQGTESDKQITTTDGQEQHSTPHEQEEVVDPDGHEQEQDATPDGQDQHSTPGGQGQGIDSHEQEQVTTPDGQEQGTDSDEQEQNITPGGQGQGIDSHEQEQVTTSDGQEPNAPMIAVDHTTEDADKASNSSARVQQYLDAIFDPTDTSFDRLQCPPDLGIRYEALRQPSASGKPKYYIAIDLYNAEHILPRLLGSLVEVIQYLGPSSCVVTIVEGRSDDLTYLVLDGLKSEFQRSGTAYHLLQNTIDPTGEGVDRIEALAELRNFALEPLVSNPTGFATDTVVLFVNDVAVCPSDMLELLYQHNVQSAHQTCAMDWVDQATRFYDVWVSRTINSGNLFYEVTYNAEKWYVDSMFWDDPPTKKLFHAYEPFEVYSCWGGMVTIDPREFISGEIRFRRSFEDECYMGEPTLLGKDFWRTGQGRIATIPSVVVSYSDTDGKYTKERRGYVSDHVDLSKVAEDTQTQIIDWKSRPPLQVKCLPYWGAQLGWVPPV